MSRIQASEASGSLQQLTLALFGRFARRSFALQVLLAVVSDCLGTGKIETRTKSHELLS